MIIKNLFKEKVVTLNNCHNGVGDVKFRVILEDELKSKISFLHFTTLPPGSSIGYHKHNDTEEVYIILQGTGLINVDNETREVFKGDVVFNSKGSSHGLLNFSNDNLDILVFEGKF